MKKLNNQLLDYIKKEHKEIIVYGAGKVAKSVLEWLLREGINVSYIAVTSIDNDPLHILGKRVVELKDIERNKKESIILVCVMEQTQEEIGAILKAFGYSNYYGISDSLYQDICAKNYSTQSDPLYNIKRYVDPYLKTIKDICEENHISKNDKHRFLMEGFKNLEFPQLRLSRLVVVLGTRCSLRCKDCNNLIPHFRPQADLNGDKIIESLKILTSRVATILKCELIGGEPFSSSNLEKVLQFVIENETIKSVEITTNGTIMPGASVIKLIQNPKVLIRISDYGPLVRKDKIVSALKEHKIRYVILELDEWIATGGVEKRGRSKEELCQNYQKCYSGYYCKTLYEDKIFACARAASLYALNYMDNEEFISVNKEFDEKRLKEFLLNTYSLACDHCDIASSEARHVEPAIQL